MLRFRKQMRASDSGVGRHPRPEWQSDHEVPCGNKYGLKEEHILPT